MHLGRPTDYLPRLHQSDVLYACGAPSMVEAIKLIAADNNMVCYANSFLPPTDDAIEKSVLNRAMGWLAVPAIRQLSQLVLDRAFHQRASRMQAQRTTEARMRNHYHS